MRQPDFAYKIGERDTAQEFHWSASTTRLCIPVEKVPFRTEGLIGIEGRELLLSIVKRTEDRRDVQVVDDVETMLPIQSLNGLPEFTREIEEPPSDPIQGSRIVERAYVSMDLDSVNQVILFRNTSDDMDFMSSDREISG